jgi:ferric-dicitrate binding protein FerR (iron transport regulator)
MPALRRFASVLLCLALSPAPLLAETAAPETKSVGHVSALLPAAMRNNVPTSINDDIYWNDLLKTTTSGRMKVGLADGSILNVGSSSELRVVSHDAATQQTSLEMGTGRLRSQVVKITQPSGKFQVRTLNTVIGVVGTDFFVSYEGRKTTVICYRGQVLATPLKGARLESKSEGVVESNGSFLLSEGQMAEIVSDEKLAVPPMIIPGGQQTAALQTASMESTEIEPGLLPKTVVHRRRRWVLPVVLISTAVVGTAVGVAVATSGGGQTPV